jgi:FMN phosphatase YigB (HAD superfamily)
MLNYTVSRHDLDHILWDLDGTLHILSPELESTIESRYLEIYSEKKRLPINDETREKLRQESREYCSMAGYMAFGLKIKDIDSLIHSRINRRPYVSIDEKLIEMFDWFNRNLPDIKHHIFSAVPYNPIIQTLDGLGLERSLFTHIFAQDYIDEKIPNPYYKPLEDLCRWIVDFLETNAARILAIGDSKKSDIKPAKSVGMRTVIVYHKSKLADVSLSDVYQVPKFFRI